MFVSLPHAPVAWRERLGRAGSKTMTAHGREHNTDYPHTQGANSAVLSTRHGEEVKFRSPGRSTFDRSRSAGPRRTMSDLVFKVEEAEALIPRLELLVEELQRCARELREGVNALASESSTSVADLSMPEVLRMRPDLHRVVEDINRSVQRIEDIGGVFKDVELGLVDFPTEIGGEPAYFCWQYGEKTIGFWHRVDDGFTGRRPLETRAAPSRRYLQ